MNKYNQPRSFHYKTKNHNQIIFSDSEYSHENENVIDCLPPIIQPSNKPSYIKIAQSHIKNAYVPFEDSQPSSNLYQTADMSSSIGFIFNQFTQHQQSPLRFRFEDSLQKESVTKLPRSSRGDRNAKKEYNSKRLSLGDSPSWLRRSEVSANKVEHDPNWTENQHSKMHCETEDRCDSSELRLSKSGFITHKSSNIEFVDQELSSSERVINTESLNGDSTKRTTQISLFYKRKEETAMSLKDHKGLGLNRCNELMKAEGLFIQETDQNLETSSEAGNNLNKLFNPFLLAVNSSGETPRDKENHVQQTMPRLDQVNLRESRTVSVPPNRSNINLNNAIENPSPTNPQSPAGRTSTNQEIIALLEAKLYIRRAITLLGTIVLLYCILIFNKENIFNKYMSLIIYLYLFFFIVENILRTHHFRREHWRVVEDIFSIIDAVGAIIFMVCVDLRNMQIISISLVSFIPFMGTAIAYSMISEAPAATKNKDTLLRVFYMIQVFMITAEIDELISFSWKIVLITASLYLIGAVVYVFIYFFRLLSSLKELYLQRRDDDADLMSQSKILGNLWFLLGYGLHVAGFMTISAIIIRNDAVGAKLLTVNIIIGLSLSALLTVFTGLASTALTTFIQMTTINDVREVIYEAPQHPLAKKSTIGLQIEKTNSYFVMLSATYFRSFESDLVSSDKKKLRSLKSKMFSPKNKRRTSTLDLQAKRCISNEGKASADKSPKGWSNSIIDTVSKVKEHITLQIKKVPSFSKPHLTARLPSIKELPHECKSNAETANDLEACNQRNMSADDIKLIIEMGLFAKDRKFTEEDKLCYLCYDNIPNAILMSCKHGGICYECAVALVKKKNECMECRRVVEAIVKVDPSPKLFDIMRGIEVTKVINIGQS